MSLSKKLLTIAAPAALLALAGCATGFPAQVSRYQAMPAPQGQTFAIVSADPDENGLEFSRYAELVRRHMIAQGYSEAPSRDAATMIVSLDYGVGDGQPHVVSRPGFGPYGGFGYSRWGFYRPYYSRFGYYGRARSPFYWGWDDPFLYGSEIDTYVVYNSFLDMDIRGADGRPLFEGTAKARSRTDNLSVLVPNLVEAMFTGFPGNSGETVKITVAPEDRR